MHYIDDYVEYNNCYDYDDVYEYNDYENYADDQDVDNVCQSLNNTAFMVDVQNESCSNCVDTCVDSHMTNERVMNNVDVASWLVG